MLGNENLPQQPSRRRSLGGSTTSAKTSLVDQERGGMEQRYNIPKQPSRRRSYHENPGRANNNIDKNKILNNDSLFGDFIKGRSDAVDFQPNEIIIQLKEESKSTTKKQSKSVAKRRSSLSCMEGGSRGGTSSSLVDKVGGRGGRSVSPAPKRRSSAVRSRKSRSPSNVTKRNSKSPSSPRSRTTSSSRKSSNSRSPSSPRSTSVRKRPTNATSKPRRWGSTDLPPVTPTRTLRKTHSMENVMKMEDLEATEGPRSPVGLARDPPKEQYKPKRCSSLTAAPYVPNNSPTFGGLSPRQNNQKSKPPKRCSSLTATSIPVSHNLGSSPRQDHKTKPPRKSPVPPVSKASPRSKAGSSRPTQGRRRSQTGKSIAESLNESFPDLAGETEAFSKIEASELSKHSVQSKADDDTFSSLPCLVDDYVVRDTINGCRSGKKWNILEDTPAGHVPDDFKIVDGVELDSEDGISWMPGKSDDDLEEDDDIVDDPGMIDEQVEVAGRRNIPDSAAAHGGQPQTFGSDRFDHAFQNPAMWNADSTPEEVQRYPCGVSLMSDHDTISELASFSGRTDSIQLWTNESKQTDESIASSSADQVKTPATFKRSGGRLATQTIMLSPDLEGSDHDGDDDIEEDSLQHPASVPENGPLENSKKKPRRRAKNMTTRITNPYEKEKSTSTRSSGRPRTGPGSRTRTRQARASSGRRHVPEVVPATPDSNGNDFVRSPMSSSLTSTPNSASLMSSAMGSRIGVQQQKSLAALKQKTAGRRNNKSLHLHVGQGNSTMSSHDDLSLGASTLSTNFTCTQRTRGDNTVSSRSLFKSERMSITESLRKPQRPRADSESDEHENMDSNASSAKKVTRGARADLDSDEEADDHMDSNSNLDGGTADLETTIENPFQKNPTRKVLRKPSGEGDDLLEMVGGESFGATSSSHSDSEASGFRRWQEENASDLLASKAALRREATKAGQSDRFLQLNQSDHGVLVNSKVAAAIDSSELGSAKIAPPSSQKLDKSLDDSDDFEQSPLKPKSASFFGRKSLEDSDDFEQSPAKPKSASFAYAKGSPSPKSKHKKKNRGLFHRVQSWKGVVALSDEEDE